MVRKFLRKIIKYTILFFVLYAAVRIGSSILRQRADERALGQLYAGYRALPKKPARCSSHRATTPAVRCST